MHKPRIDWKWHIENLALAKALPTFVEIILIQFFTDFYNTVESIDVIFPVINPDNQIPTGHTYCIYCWAAN